MMISRLVAVLRDIGLDVVELPPDNTCPLSFLVGDIAFVLNGMGFVAKPKLGFRQTEVFFYLRNPLALSMTSNI